MDKQKNQLPWVSYSNNRHFSKPDVAVILKEKAINVAHLWNGVRLSIGVRGQMVSWCPININFCGFPVQKSKLVQKLSNITSIFLFSIFMSVFLTSRMSVRRSGWLLFTAVSVGIGQCEKSCNHYFRLALDCRLCLVSACCLCFHSCCSVVCIGRLSSAAKFVRCYTRTYELLKRLFRFLLTVFGALSKLHSFVSFRLCSGGCVWLTAAIFRKFLAPVNGLLWTGVCVCQNSCKLLFLYLEMDAVVAVHSRNLWLCKKGERIRILICNLRLCLNRGTQKSRARLWSQSNGLFAKKVADSTNDWMVFFAKFGSESRETFTHTHTHMSPNLLGRSMIQMIKFGLVRWTMLSYMCSFVGK